MTLKSIKQALSNGRPTRMRRAPKIKDSYALGMVSGGAHGLACACSLAKHMASEKWPSWSSTPSGSDTGHTDSAGRTMRRHAEVNGPQGVDSRFIFLEEIERLCQPLDVGDDPRYPIQAARTYAPGSLVRCDALVWGDAYRAHRLGVHIHQQTELTGINLERGQIRGVETTQRPIQTATVLNAAAVDPFASYSNRGSLGSSEGIAGRKLELFPPLGPARLMRRWAGICDRTADYILSRE